MSRKGDSAKGALLERRAMELLGELGYRRRHRAVRTPVFRNGRYYSNSNDVRGVFDIEAVSPTRPVRYVQVTTEAQASVRKRKVEPVAADRLPGRTPVP